MKKHLSIVLAILMVAAFAAGCAQPAPTAATDSPAPAAPETTEGAETSEEFNPEITGSYLMGTGSATGNYYAFGSILAQVINSHTGANITVNSTGGSVENARLIASGENEMALIQTDVSSYAIDGIEQFEGTPIDNYSIVTACYPEMVQIVARKDSGITSVADMRGKRICVGAVGSGYEVAARQILGAYDLTYDDIDERFLSQAEGKNALQDGQIDAFFMCSGYPNSNVTELSLNGNINVISIDEEHLNKILDMYPFYTEFTTETDEYNLGYSITSVAVMSMLIVSNDFTEEEIYALTAAIYDNLDEIKELNSKADQYMSLEGAFRGVAGNVHPGAARYYEEKGLTVPGK